MKLLKLITIAALATIGAFAMVTYSSCTDACKDVACLNGGACQDGKCVCPAGFMGNNCEKTLCTGIDCKNGGECKDGKCLCPAGYEGEFCEKVIAEKFYGKWTGSITCSGSPFFNASYEISKGVGYLDVSVKETIELSGGPTTTTFTGTVSDTKTIVITKQSISTTQMVEGKITIDGNKITFDKTVTNAGTGSGSCTAQCTK